MTTDTRVRCKCGGIVYRDGVDAIRFGYAGRCCECGAKFLDDDYSTLALCWQCEALYRAEEAGDPCPCWEEYNAQA